MMSLQQTFLNNKDKIILLRTSNSFKYKGQILDCSKEFLKIHDIKTDSEISLRLDFITEFAFEGDNQFQLNNGR